MKGDFSRLGFDPARRRPAVAVLMQQGRVQLDADFNEQAAIAERLRRTGLADAAGPAGAPARGGGMAVSVTPPGDDLAIAGGSYHVQGLLCALPDTTIRTQPDLAAADPFGLGEGVAPVRGRYLAYLDVWGRHVTAQEDPELIEPALGGPDTTTRLRQVCQVRLHPVEATAAADAFGADWSPLPDDPPGALAATVTAPDLAQSPCFLPPHAGYTALTNQLYRVEVHDGGTLPPGDGPPPTWKWSRDNGAVVTAVTGIVGADLSVADLGPSDALGFGPQQVVELCLPADELANRPGPLQVIASVAAETRTVTLAAAFEGGADTGGTARLRRWDQPPSGPAALPITAEPSLLEQGITVQFAEGRYRAGDWWTVPARTAIDEDTGTILWPAGAFLPAEGIRHAYAPLALVDVDAQGLFHLVEDCRIPLVPLGGRIPLKASWRPDAAPQPLAGGTVMSREALARGLVLSTPVALDASTVKAGTVELFVEAPVLMSSVLPGVDDARVVGRRSLALACEVTLGAPGRIEVRPSAPALDLVDALLSRPLLSFDQSDFSRAFSTVSLGRVPPAWVIRADGTVSQTVPNAGSDIYFPPTPPGVPQPVLALASLHLRSPLAHVGLTCSPEERDYGDAGLVFNFTSSRDFWVFYISRLSRRYTMFAGADVAAATLTHFVNGAPAAEASSDLSIGLDTWTADTAADLDIVERRDGLSFGIVWRVRTDGRRLVERTLNFSAARPPGQLDPAGSIGLMTRSHVANFSRLRGTTRDDQAVTILPLGSNAPLPMRLVARRAQLRSSGEPTFGFQPAEPPFEIGFQVAPPAEAGDYGHAPAGYPRPATGYLSRLPGYAGRFGGLGTGWL